MNRPHFSLLLALACLLPLTALAGCGGDDDDSAPPAAGGTAGASGAAGAGAGGAGSGGVAGGAGASGTAGTAGAGGGAGVKGDLCSSPAEAPSKGSCYEPPAGGCNPVTSEGCKAGEACDDDGLDGYACFPVASGAAALCQPCGGEALCGATLSCRDGACARYCCDDADCGSATCLKGEGGKPGVCAVVECKADQDCAEPGAKCSGGRCVVKGDCCTAGDTPGCKDAAIEACVCAQQPSCCSDVWDGVCVTAVVASSCGPACPGTCATSADCTLAPATVCDASSNVCVSPQCQKDDDCEFGVCLDGLCVECKVNDDCLGELALCSQDNFCVQCEADADCAANPYAKVCDPDEGLCRQPPCAANADCKDPAAPRCQVDGSRCVECLEDADCKDPERPTCETELGTCFAPTTWDPVCDAPETAASKGACYTPPAGGCNPVTNEGCKADEVCDEGGDTVYSCYPASGGDQQLCQSCGGDGMFCAATFGCIGTCARYCCDDADCGPEGRCDHDSSNSDAVGFCLLK